MKLASVRLIVDDFAACHRFYTGVLGLVPRFGSGEAVGVYEEFAPTGAAADGVTLALFDRALMAAAVGTVGRGRPAVGGDPVVVAFAVDDVDAAFARMSAAGGAVAGPPTDQPQWMLRVAHFRDPCGNLVEINGPIRA